MENKQNYTALDELRRSIDSIDEEILKLINKRLEIAIAIGKVKEKKGEPIIDIARENSIIDRLVRKNEGPVGTDTMEKIFRIIIAGSREIQRQIHNAG
jgi:chorismate mutase / prephenate dehydratase